MGNGYTYENYQKSAEYIKSKLPEMPKTAVVLGSGLGGYAEGLLDKTAIKYEQIPNFPKATVENHKGELVFGTLAASGKPVLVMSGRFHFYEGYNMQQTAYPIGVFGLLGIKNLVLTNAAGGINPTYRPGDLVCVYDHIKLSDDSPIRGEIIPELGPRFFDMGDAYSREMIETAKECAINLGFALKEGVYAYMSGPQYETPAEIRALKALGADLVGMSTVAEVIQAARCGMKTLCISCVTNYAAGLKPGPITYGEVAQIGREVSEKFKNLLDAILTRGN